MNEITRIHLGRQSFTISVAAHRVLEKYITAIRAQVDDQSEIIEEVESRMAELLTERGVHGEKVVVEADVDFLKAQLGKPKDFHSDDDSVGTLLQDEAPHAKRLFRDPEGAWVAGVAAGLGSYLGIDALIIRAVFILLSFWGGVGILLYLLMWILVPEAKTKSDRLQMQGRPVTVDSIKDFMTRSDVEHKAKQTGGVIRRVIESGAKILLTFAGIFIMVLGVLLFFSVVTSAMFLLIDPSQLIGVRNFFPVTALDYVVVVAIVVFFALITILQIMFGRLLILRRAVAKARTVWAIGILLVLSMAVLAATGVKEGFNLRDRYQAQLVTSTQNTAAFSDVTASGEGRVQYIPSSHFEIKVRGPKDSLHGQVRYQVTNGELRIDFPVKENDCTSFCAGSGLWWNDVTVYSPTLRNVTMQDGAQFTNAQTLGQSDLSLWIQPGSYARIDRIAAERVDVEGTHMKLKGLTKEADTDNYISYNGQDFDVATAVTTLNFIGKCALSNSPRVTLLQLPVHLIINGHQASASDVRSSSPFADDRCVNLQD
jgi:phage shock protein PspC (stress-responsive transcriptional regulator)